MVMTAATPMTMPRMVRKERMKLRRIARSASRTVFHSIIRPLARAVDRSSMRPSTKWTMRLAKAAMSGSWVTITTVMPWSRLRTVSNSMISRLRCVSRLPVGSSASRSAAGDDGAGDRDPLLLSAGELARRVLFPAVQAHRCQRRARGRMPRGGRLAAIEQRQLDVLERRRAREQIEALEHEAEVVPAQQRALIARQRSRRARPGTDTRPGRHIETAEDIHQVDLPEPLGPMIATNSPSSIRRSTPRKA